MNSPRRLTQREQNLIELYMYCELGMTPNQFYAKWQVSYERMAAICDPRSGSLRDRSTSTVQRWFAKGRHYRRPTSMDLRHLAIVNFLLEHFEEIPEELRDLLCPTYRGEGI